MAERNGGQRLSAGVTGRLSLGDILFIFMAPECVLALAAGLGAWSFERVRVVAADLGPQLIADLLVPVSLFSITMCIGFIIRLGSSTRWAERLSADVGAGAGVSTAHRLLYVCIWVLAVQSLFSLSVLVTRYPGGEPDPVAQAEPPSRLLTTLGVWACVFVAMTAVGLFARLVTIIAATLSSLEDNEAMNAERETT